METSSRAFTNGPEGNLLLTLSDDNSSLQLRPKSVKNRIIPIITIITILANRQGALAALGEAHLFNYLEDVSISTSVPTKNKNKNKKKLRTISIVRYGKPWVMQRSAPNSSVVFIQVSRLILPEKKKKKKKETLDLSVAMFTFYLDDCKAQCDITWSRFYLRAPEDELSKVMAV